MTKDEMKNRISMALKDPILQQGFEIVCKNLSELEKENAGLKADRPKWHKVADGDLPKETGEYLTNIGVLIWDYYADGRYGWHTPFCEVCDCCDNVDSDEVVAWCEIPEYTEE